MSMQAIILAIIALLAFPFGLIMGVFVGVLVQDLRTINKQLSRSDEVFFQLSCPSEGDEHVGRYSYRDDR
ncbi:MAG: hypothetical protein AB1611_08740 [bacterium]